MQLYKHVIGLIYHLFNNIFNSVTIKFNYINNIYNYIYIFNI